MNFLLFIGICGFSVISLFLILSILFSAPSGRQSLAKYHVHHPNAQNQSIYSKIQLLLANWLGNLPIQKLTNKIQPILEYDNKKRSAEMYLSDIVIKTAILMIISLIGGFILPQLFLVCFIVPVIIYYDEYKQLQQLIKTKKEKLEEDLPSFIGAVLSALETDRDVIRMISNYIPYAEPELKSELKITLSDMQSGNYEKALLRLDRRIASSHLSAVVRGLIGVIHGNDEKIYLQLLSHTIRQAELTKQKQRALKSKPKFLFAAVIVLLSSLVVVFGVVIIDLMAKSNQLFG